MGAITSKSLYSLLIEEINKKLGVGSSDSSNVAARQSIAPLALSEASGVTQASLSELVTSVQTLLGASLPNIISNGLIISATDPVSNSVIVSAGYGSAKAILYTLVVDTTVFVPLSLNNVLYISLYKDSININNNIDPKKLTIGKIVIPDSNAQFINNTDDGSGEAYIVNYQPLNLYKNQYGGLEEDSLTFLREIIGEVLADNLIGNIELSENLTITNTQGSISLDSQQILILNNDGNILTKLDRTGTFFYDNNGIQLAKFGFDEARIGNMILNKNSLSSGNYVEGSTGFKINDNGSTEFSDVTVRGTIYATLGHIGGFTITDTMLYGGTLQTSLDVGVGESGVIIDSDGLRGYSSLLGEVFNIPTDGSAPTFSSGIIQETIFEINTNSVLRTSDTVGDGSSDSAGVLINNTGLYACGPNQLLVNANLKADVNGNISVSGEIISSQGQIGGVTITSTSLSGGLIQGSTLIGSVIETSTGIPRIRMDSTGIYYQITSDIGTYGEADSLSSGFMYGDGTLYGSGVTAYLFNENFPILTIFAERNLADIRLYNRVSDPVDGDHEIGDLIVVGGKLKICTTAGTPGAFSIVGTQS